jgi:HPt (histidine-containing phosphotransfer) domain-containing protein
MKKWDIVRLIDQWYYCIAIILGLLFIVGSDAPLIHGVVSRITGDKFWGETAVKILYKLPERLIFDAFVVLSVVHFRKPIGRVINKFLSKRGLYTDHRIFADLHEMKTRADSLQLNSDKGKNELLKTCVKLKIDSYYSELYHVAEAVENRRMKHSAACCKNLQYELIGRADEKWIKSIKKLLKDQKWPTDKIAYLADRIQEIYSEHRARLSNNISTPQNNLHQILSAYDNFYKDINNSMRDCGLTINGKLNGLSFKGFTIEENLHLPLGNFDQEFIKEQLDTYVVSAHERIGEIKDALHCGSLEDFQKHVHFLKNSAANVGSQSLYIFLEEASIDASKGNLPKNKGIWYDRLKHYHKKGKEFLYKSYFKEE